MLHQLQDLHGDSFQASEATAEAEYHTAIGLIVQSCRENHCRSARFVIVKQDILIKVILRSRSVQLLTAYILARKSPLAVLNVVRNDYVEILLEPN